MAAKARKGTLQFPTDIVIRGGEVFVLGGSKITILDLDGRVRKEVSSDGRQLRWTRRTSRR